MSIYIYFISSAIALTAIVLSYIMYKTYRFEYLSAYLYYLIAFYIMIFISKCIRYMLLATLGVESPYTFKTMVLLMTFLVTPFFITGLYMFIKFIRGLLEKKLSRIFKRIFFVSCGMFLLCFVKLTKDFFEKDDDTLMTMMDYADWVVIGISYFMVLQLFFKAKTVSGRNKQKALRMFAVIYFFSHAFYNAAALDLVPFLYFDFFLLLFLQFFYNLPPLFFLRRYLKKNHPVESALTGKGETLEQILSEYNISSREQEIIHLICQGKTNKEIEDVLFISLQTVKHHIYNIYKKMGIKNRVQLTNMVRGVTTGGEVSS